MIEKRVNIFFLWFLEAVVVQCWNLFTEWGLCFDGFWTDSIDRQMELIVFLFRFCIDHEKMCMWWIQEKTKRASSAHRKRTTEKKNMWFRTMNCIVNLNMFNNWVKEFLVENMEEERIKQALQLRSNIKSIFFFFFDSPNHDFEWCHSCATRSLSWACSSESTWRFPAAE